MVGGGGTAGATGAAATRLADLVVEAAVLQLKNLPSLLESSKGPSPAQGEVLFWSQLHTESMSQTVTNLQASNLSIVSVTEPLLQQKNVKSTWVRVLSPQV